MQLSQLLKAGLPLTESLELLKDQDLGSGLREVTIGLLDKLQKGRTLSSALSDYPSLFESRFASLVAAGEAGGDLSQAFAAWLKLLDAEEARRKKIFSLLFYPSLVVGMAFIVITVILFVVIPSLRELFQVEPKGFAGLVFQLSAFLQSNGLYLVLAFGVVLGAFAFSSIRQKIKSFFRSALFKSRYFRSLFLSSSLSTLSFTLSELLRGGLDLSEALAICQNGEGWKDQFLKESIKGLQEGRSWSLTCQNQRFLPKLFAKMIAVGEDTGEMSQSLQRLSSYFEDDFQRRVEKLLAIAQPLILLSIGAFVALIMLSVLIPLSDPTLLLGD